MDTIEKRALSFSLKVEKLWNGYIVGQFDSHPAN